MGRSPKDSFYRKLKLPKDITEIMKVWKKLKKHLDRDASRTGVGK